MPDTYQSLFWGYLVMWGLIVAYLVRLGLAVRGLEKRLDNHDRDHA